MRLIIFFRSVWLVDWKETWERGLIPWELRRENLRRSELCGVKDPAVTSDLCFSSSLRTCPGCVSGDDEANSSGTQTLTTETEDTLVLDCNAVRVLVSSIQKAR